LRGWKRRERKGVEVREGMEGEGTEGRGRWEEKRRRE